MRSKDQRLAKLLQNLSTRHRCRFLEACHPNFIVFIAPGLAKISPCENRRPSGRFRQRRCARRPLRRGRSARTTRGAESSSALPRDELLTFFEMFLMMKIRVAAKKLISFFSHDTLESSDGRDQGCQIFLGMTYQNVKNIPNGHKMYRTVKNILNVHKTYLMAVNRPTGYKIHQHLPLQDPPNLPKLGFLV
jgi:hypothetical protein